MNVLVCAMVPRDRRWIDLVDGHPIDFPASIVVGKQVRAGCQRMMMVTVAAQVFRSFGRRDRVFPGVLVVAALQHL